MAHYGFGTSGEYAREISGAWRRRGLCRAGAPRRGVCLVSSTIKLAVWYSRRMGNTRLLNWCDCPEQALCEWPKLNLLFSAPLCPCKPELGKRWEAALPEPLCEEAGFSVAARWTQVRSCGCRWLSWAALGSGGEAAWFRWGTTLCVQLGTFLMTAGVNSLGHRGVSSLAAQCRMRCFAIAVAHSHDPCSAQCGSERCPAVKGGLEFHLHSWPLGQALADEANTGGFGSADWTRLWEAGSSRTEIHLIVFFF